MRSVLEAISVSPRLELQLVVTGMHLDKNRGMGIRQIRNEGWKIDAVIPWKQDETSAVSVARATGLATAKMAEAFARLKSDVVIVVGDRVEAFAAASAAHVSRIVLAHVHGGDRAQGQIDDSLRHAISKLAHVHFPATREAADRLLAMGEDAWRITVAGSPGLDGIWQQAAAWKEIQQRVPGLVQGEYVLVALHPSDGDVPAEQKRAKIVINGVRRGMALAGGVSPVVIIGPNNDPGSKGIIAGWRVEMLNGEARKLKGNAGGRKALAKGLGKVGGSQVLQAKMDEPARAEDLTGRVVYFADLPRQEFLGLMKHAAVMVGNSSAGIIEAASFGLPVVDIGPRQRGRLRGENVRSVPFVVRAIALAVQAAMEGRSGRQTTKRPHKINVYGDGKAGWRIARKLAALPDRRRNLDKLISI